MRLLLEAEKQKRVERQHLAGARGIESVKERAERERARARARELKRSVAGDGRVSNAPEIARPRYDLRRIYDAPIAHAPTELLPGSRARRNRSRKE
jgi:hypothetical protein